MKTFLGVMTGLMVGVALGIAGVTMRCIESPGYMKFFAETCGYNYAETKEEKAE